jgi:signal transduction histidine kinase
MLTLTKYLTRFAIRTSLERVTSYIADLMLTKDSLSAMLHCSDEVIVSLEGCLLGLNKITTPDPNGLARHMTSGTISLLGTAQHSANTIVYCIQHLRRVVDDVLTLSKLDSDLLIVSPCALQPVELVREALQIFEGQLQKADIEFEIQEDQSLQDLGMDWVTLDPGRVLQVLMSECLTS